MKVSVIIRTYNRGYILREAIESVLKQTYCDFEIIVVDDGSTDNTSEVVAIYQDLNLRCVRHAQNRGVSAACNTGIEASVGELVAFLDSDDLWKPDYLERQTNFLTRHPEVDAVFSDSMIDLTPAPIPSIVGLMTRFPRLLKNRGQDSEHIVTGRQMYLCLLEEVPIKPSGLVIKRVMFEKTGMFDEGWRCGEDWEFFLRLARFACFGYVDSPLIIQRRTPDATHKKYLEMDRLFLLRLFAKEKRSLRVDPAALEAVNRGIYLHCKSLAGVYLIAGKRREATAVYLQGFRETKKVDMLFRAASVFVPGRLRGFLIRLFKGAHASLATPPIDL
jgi:glycosyltransferase involved in cell wall biosynthesis